MTPLEHAGDCYVKSFIVFVFILRCFHQDCNLSGILVTFLNVVFFLHIHYSVCLEGEINYV